MGDVVALLRVAGRIEATLTAERCWSPGQGEQGWGAALPGELLG
ncbi:hypothetical protein [Saccharopolyspora spinosa]|nr:hypothetical protein [Saccharopolyspora spinosa]